MCALSRFSRVRLFVTLWMVACQALVHHLVHQGNLSPAGLGVIFRLLGKGKALLPSKLKHVSNCVPKVFSRNFSSGAFILAPWPRPGLSWPLLLVGCVWRCGTAWSGEPVWPEEEGQWAGHRGLWFGRPLSPAHLFPREVSLGLGRSWVLRAGRKPEMEAPS